MIMANSNTAHSKELRARTSREANKRKLKSGVYKHIGFILTNKDYIDKVAKLKTSPLETFKIGVDAVLNLQKNTDIT